jgi:hypothetical protein
MVNTAADSATGPILGSLRYDLAHAQNGDTIEFDPRLKNSTIVLGSSNNPLVQNASNEIDITKSVTIQGLGAANLAIDGHGFSRVFAVGLGAQVTISGMTIENGNGSNGTFDANAYEGRGGGIVNLGTLTLTRCTVSGNSANGPGQGGGIYNASTMTLSGCSVTGNTGGFDGGGGIYNAAGASLTLLSSTATGNTAPGGGADLYSFGWVGESNSVIGYEVGKIHKL